jgi:hypothetical protein
MKKYFIPQTGDIFSIKIDSSRYAFGQVVFADIVGLNIIFDIISDQCPLLEEVIKTPIILIGYTTYNFIANGEWRIVGNANIPTNLHYPKHIAETYINGELKTMLYSHDHKQLGEASEIEKRLLKNHKSYSPKVIEEAIKAWFGLLPWQVYYDELLYRN